MKDNEERNEDDKIVKSGLDDLSLDDAIFDELFEELIDNDKADSNDKSLEDSTESSQQDDIIDQAQEVVDEIIEVDKAIFETVNDDSGLNELSPEDNPSIGGDNLLEKAQEEEPEEEVKKKTSKNKFKDLINDEDSQDISFSLNIEAPEIIKQQQEHLKEQEKLMREKEKLENTKEFIIEESIVYDPAAEKEAAEAQKSQSSKPTKKAKQKPAKKAKDTKQKPSKQKSAKQKPAVGTKAQPRVTKKGLMIGLSVVLLVAIGGAAITSISKGKQSVDSEVQNVAPLDSPDTVEDLPVDEVLDEDALNNGLDTETDEALEEEVVDEVVEDETLENTEDAIDATEEVSNELETPTEDTTGPVVTTPLNTENMISGVIQNVVVDNVIVLQGDEVIVYSMSDEVKASIGNFKSGDSISFEALENGDSMVMISVSAPKQEAEKPVDELNTDDLEALLANEPEQIITENQEFNEAFASDFEGELDLIREREIQEALRQSELAEKERIESQNKTPEVTKETLEYEMEAKGSGVLWFRFAWKPNDVTKEVAPIDNVRVELRSPNGTLVTPENASQSGRYWVDKGIVNYAIKAGSAGKWKFVVTKNKTEKLGEIGATVSPGTGFIKIDKVSVQPRENKLLAIWKVSGVKDEELAIEIFAKRGNSEFLIYSANSADSKIYLLDKAEISTQKLEKGTYDIIIKVQDIDISVDKKTGNKIITSKSISDIYEIKNVDIY